MSRRDEYIVHKFVGVVMGGAHAAGTKPEASLRMATATSTLRNRRLDLWGKRAQRCPNWGGMLGLVCLELRDGNCQSILCHGLNYFPSSSDNKVKNEVHMRQWRRWLRITCSEIFATRKGLAFLCPPHRSIHTSRLVISGSWGIICPVSAHALQIVRDAQRF